MPLHTAPDVTVPDAPVAIVVDIALPPAATVSVPLDSKVAPLSRPPDRRTAIYFSDMYLVTKRLEFCYGHRLLDYDGVCKHPHGHKASVEVDVRTDRLDERNMVADFSDRPLIGVYRSGSVKNARS